MIKYIHCAFSFLVFIIISKNDLSLALMVILQCLTVFENCLSFVSRLFALLFYFQNTSEMLKQCKSDYFLSIYRDNMYIVSLFEFWDNLRFICSFKKFRERDPMCLLHSVPQWKYLTKLKYIITTKILILIQFTSLTQTFPVLLTFVCVYTFLVLNSFVKYILL